MDARELTRDEKKKIRSLVTGMCANYDRETGLCLPLDCGCYMLHKCWTGAYCRYFREAVLPLDPELLAALTVEGGSPELRACTVCGRAFLPEGRQFGPVRSAGGHFYPKAVKPTVPTPARPKETAGKAGNA